MILTEASRTVEALRVSLNGEGRSRPLLAPTLASRRPLAVLGARSAQATLSAGAEMTEMPPVTARSQRRRRSAGASSVAAAWCGQLRHVVACTARLSGSDRDFAGDELALALGQSSLTGRALMWEYGAIASLPGLVEAVKVGRLSVRHVKAVMRVLDEVSLPLSQRQTVALIALARYAGQTPPGEDRPTQSPVLPPD